MAIAIGRLIDDAKCYEMVRELRWPQGVRCPDCTSGQVVKNGHDTTEVCRQRYRCRDCDRCFDDLTDTVFAGHHQPLRIWMLCSYLMGLNLSNQQIATELDLSQTQAQEMATKLRQGIADRQYPSCEPHLGARGRLERSTSTVSRSKPWDAIWSWNVRGVIGFGGMSVAI